MSEDKRCEKCPQSHDCGEVYKKMSESRTGPVTLGVTIAFLVPMLAFIIALWILDLSLTPIIENQALRGLVCFVLSAGVALLSALFAKWIRNLFKKDTNNCKKEGLKD